MVNFKLGNEMCHVDQFTFHVSLPSLKCSHLLEVGHVQWMQHVRSVPYKKNPNRGSLTVLHKRFAIFSVFLSLHQRLLGFINYIDMVALCNMLV